MNPGLSYAASPPLAVPLRWFLSVPAFGMLAGLWLLYAGPAVLAERWQPATLAFVHLLALGVLLTAMLGALIQLLPVLVGAPIRRPAAVGAGVHTLFVPGVLLLAGGLGSGAGAPVRVGVTLLAGALLVFTSAAVSAWRRSPRGGESARTIAWAGLAFGIAAGIGLLLAAGYGWDAVPLYRRYTDLHAGWALLGWVGLLVAAVAYQVVPMFSVTAPYPGWLRVLYAPVLLVALALASAGAFVPLPYALRVGASLAGAAAVLAFAGWTLHLQRTRRRRLPDPWLHYWSLALVAAALAALGWLAGYAWPALWAWPGYEVLLGALWLAGFGTTLVAGMLHKIVAFLVWLDLSTRLRAVVRGRAPPNVRELIPEAAIRRHLYVHAAAIVLLVVAVGVPVLARPAGALAFVAWALLALNLYRAVRTQRDWGRRIAALAAGGPEQAVT